jgi:AGZA family xanthine/uracil permease-like MFS transporter
MTAVDRYFRITDRGSTVAREVRGGLATFFTMAYIVVLNPLISAAPRTSTARRSASSRSRPAPPSSRPS